MSVFKERAELAINELAFILLVKVLSLSGFKVILLSVSVSLPTLIELVAINELAINELAFILLVNVLSLSGSKVILLLVSISHPTLLELVIIKKPII